MKRGEAKIEFYSNLNYFKKEFESGCVVSKFLYERAKKEKGILMTYSQFNKYFNGVFKDAKKVKDIPLVPENKEPIKLKIDTRSKKVFDAKFGKKINDEDLL